MQIWKKIHYNVLENINTKGRRVLSESEFKLLLDMKKYQDDDEEYTLPPAKGVCAVPLVSRDRRERFLLDIRKKNVQITKGTFQNRQNKIILARLDFGGRPHRNPDSTEVAPPHLHLYRAGFGAKWAHPLPAEFSNASDLWELFGDFLRYCNIEKINVRELLI